MHRRVVTSLSAKGMYASTGCKLLRAAPLAAVSSREAYRRQTFASASRALRPSSPFRVQRSADAMTDSSHTAARQMRCAASSGEMSTRSSEAYNKLQTTKVEPRSVSFAYDLVHLANAATPHYLMLAAGRWMSVITQACFCSIALQGRKIWRSAVALALRKSASLTGCRARLRSADRRPLGLLCHSQAPCSPTSSSTGDVTRPGRGRSGSCRSRRRWTSRHCGATATGRS